MEAQEVIAGVIRRFWSRVVEAWRASKNKNPADERLENDFRRQLRRERERPFPMF